jgi:U11/U12 small nuclear ribonucleoprotein SNRNP25
VKDVAVSNAATVKDLKLAIRKKINEIEQEQMGHRHISWYGKSFLWTIACF